MLETVEIIIQMNIFKKLSKVMELDCRLDNLYEVLAHFHYSQNMSMYNAPNP